MFAARRGHRVGGHLVLMEHIRAVVEVVGRITRAGKGFKLVGLVLALAVVLAKSAQLATSTANQGTARSHEPL